MPQTPVPSTAAAAPSPGVPRKLGGVQSWEWNVCDRNVIRADPHPKAQAWSLTGSSSGLAPPRSLWSPLDAH